MHIKITVSLAFHHNEINSLAEHLPQTPKEAKPVR